MSRRMALAARWGTLCVAVTLTACSEKETNPGNGDTGTPTTNDSPGTVTGIVLDTQGRPLADAEVQMEPSVTAGTPVTVHTGADGRYRAEGIGGRPASDRRTSADRDPPRCDRSEPCAPAALGP